MKERELSEYEKRILNRLREEGPLTLTQLSFDPVTKVYTDNVMAYGRLNYLIQRGLIKRGESWTGTFLYAAVEAEQDD
jgi:DNA-binding Lrp family transcriptional regulator